MCNLLIVVHQIELWGNWWVVLVLILANLEQNFDHVLCALLHLALMQQVAKSLKDTLVSARGLLCKERSNLLHESNCNLYRVVCGLAEQQEQHLEGQEFVCDPLVSQVGNEHCSGETRGLVVSLVRLPELNNQSSNKQLSDLGQLCVDDSYDGGIDGSEWQGRCLRLHD